jgi:hypothetical protein
VKRLLGLMALLATACSSGATVLSADFRGPAAVAGFWGAGDETTGLVPWLAVASSRGDELRLIDPATDRPQRSANLAFPLSIPTLARPFHLASGSLQDGGPDALVVASSGLLIQLVGTWYTPVNRTPLIAVAAQWDLTNLVEPGSEILALTIAAVPSGEPAGVPPVYAATPGKAWVVAALSGGSSGGAGKLVVLEVARGDGGSIALAGAAQVKPLGFDAVAISAAPDNFHLYLATGDPIPGPNGGASVFGIAEVDASGGLTQPWAVRGLDGRAPTTTVAAAIVGERKVETWWDFDAPALRVYAAIAPSGCGPLERIECGIATFDPARGGLAADPAPDIGYVPKQSYRAPMRSASIPLAVGVAMPPENPGTVAPGLVNGSQVCFSPATPGNPLPVCPDAGLPGGGFVLFNGNGIAQRFMQLAAGSLWWSTASMLVATGDGNTFLVDLGRFGPLNFVSALNDPTTRTQVVKALPVGPAGPAGGTALLGFPDNTSAVSLLTSKGVVDTDPLEMINDITIWPGFTKSESWLASYQGVLPSLASRRGVVGLAADGASLYVALQEAYSPPPSGVLPASTPWVPGLEVGSPVFGIHAADVPGQTGDITQFILDTDPCTPTRPNWVPTGTLTPVYDSTKPPQAHEAPIGSLLPPDPVLYPSGALLLALPTDPTLAGEYACLVDALRQQPGNVFTAFQTVATSTTDYLRGIWIRAGGFLLVGSSSGYAGRPALGVRYNFAWADEESLSGEALLVARKARRFWYPAYYESCDLEPGCYTGFPEMIDPMEPGPVVGFTLGSYCQTSVTPADCNAATSPPARDAGVSFATTSGFAPVTRRPLNASVGTSTSTFDKSLIGQENKGRVYYTTFAGGALFDVPPGLDSGQSVTIR